MPSLRLNTNLQLISLLLLLMPGAFRTAAQQALLPSLNDLQSGTGERRALLVGISDYERGTNPADAFGHLNTKPDLTNMSYVLKTYYFFPETNIEVLQNEAATQENIVREFKQHLIDKAKPGDQLLFYYTGHGHFVVDKSGDEVTDHLDEALVTWVPSEKQKLPKDKRHALMYMLDDTYEELLKQLVQRMKGPDGKMIGSVTVIFDSCHSGSGTRGLLVPKGRPWIESIDGPLPTRVVKSEIASGWLSNKSDLTDIVFIAASRSDQLSYMMPDSINNGSILTHYLTEFLTDAARRTADPITYDDLYRWVSFKTASMRAAQTPQIEGQANRKIFGDGTNVKKAFVATVQRIQTGPLRLQLNIGMLHGVTKGSRFNIYKNGVDIRNAVNRLAELQISEVASTTSTGIITNPNPAQLDPSTFEAAQAVATEFRFDGQPLRVLIDSNFPEGKEKTLRDAVLSLGFIATDNVTADTYDVRLAWDVEKGNYIYQRANGEKIFLATTADLQSLQRRLLADWRWRRLASLTLPGNPKVRIDMLGTDGGPIKRSEGGTIVLRPGDKARVVCTNDSGSPVFITLIQLKAGGEIEVFPGPEQANGQQALNADNLPRHLFDIDSVTAVSGNEVEILKIIATRRPQNFSGISFTGRALAPRRNGPTTALVDLLFGLVESKARDVSVRSQEVDEWYTDQIVYEIQPI